VTTPASGFISFDVRPCPACGLPVEQSKWGVVVNLAEEERLEAYWRVDEHHTAPCGAMCIEGQPLAIRNAGMHGFAHKCPRCDLVLQ
jgi:hypothetical protein